MGNEGTLKTGTGTGKLGPGHSVLGSEVAELVFSE